MDLAESTDLVGLYILYNLTAYAEINLDSIKVYRDDGLMVVKNSMKIKVDKLRSLDLKVKINTNIKQVNFLELMLDLVNDNFQHYMKNNANPIYIHPNSNPPSSVIQHIPASVKCTISNQSSKMCLRNIAVCTINL